MANSNFEDMVGVLEDIMKEHDRHLSGLHDKHAGIRSTQIGTLILFLLMVGIIKPKDIERYWEEWGTKEAPDGTEDRQE